ncbi:hypothetical protein ACFQS7_03840 [Dankookia sp. GCM10030260]|uniref:hypothetical protein n=1 Tax=Dankookia sp. GCM10030260 TaxID=3273390 RepID=UPI0036084C01
MKRICGPLKQAPAETIHPPRALLHSANAAFETHSAETLQQSLTLTMSMTLPYQIRLGLAEIAWQAPLIDPIHLAPVSESRRDFACDRAIC